MLHLLLAIVEEATNQKPNSESIQNHCEDIDKSQSSTKVEGATEGSGG